MQHCAKLATTVYAVRAVLAAALCVYVHRAHAIADAHIWARIYWIAPFAVAVVSCWMVTVKLSWPRFKRVRLRDLSEGLTFSFSNSSISAYNDIDKTFLVSLGQTYPAKIYSAAYRVIDAVTAPLYCVAVRRLYCGHSKALPRGRPQRECRERAGKEAAATDNALWCCRCRRALSRSGVGAAAFGAVVPGFGGCSPLAVSASAAARTAFCVGDDDYRVGLAVNWTAIQLGAGGLNLLLNFLPIPKWSWQGGCCRQPDHRWLAAISSWTVLHHIRRRERPIPQPALVTLSPAD